MDKSITPVHRIEGKRPIMPSMEGKTLPPPTYNPKAEEPQKQEGKESPKEERVPEGRLIGGNVGIGSENHPDDVEAVMQSLLSMGIINQREYTQRDESSIGRYIIRYQKRIFKTVRDGVVEKGGKTETNLIQGNPGKVESSPKPEKKEEGAQTPSAHGGGGIDYRGLARKLHIALNGNILGAGKDPAAALNALRVAKPNVQQVQKLAATYMTTFQKNLAEDIRSAYLNNGGGSDLDPVWEALGLMKKAEGKSDQKQEKPKEKKKAGKMESIPAVLSDGQFYSQLAGESAVPLSFLKKNMNKHNSEKGYRYNGCYQTCRYTLLEAGFQPEGITSSKYLVDVSYSGKRGTDSFKKKLDGVADSAAEAKSKLDAMLESGKPVVAGVNRDSQKHNARWTNTKLDGGLSPTDHFVIIVGRQVMENGNIAYRYFDPGRTARSNGTDPKNLLVIDKNGYVSGEGYKSTYTLSEIRNTESQ